MNVSVAVDLLLAMLQNAGQISALIQKAKANGSDTISPEDWLTITDADDAARERLEHAIATAKLE